MNTQTEKRSMFDWLIFTLIHLVVIGAIGTVGFYVYTWNLGIWVAASATVAGFASCYMFAKEIPGETFMKVILGLAVAANAGYLAHNGAKKIGVEDYNNKQVEKFEKGMAEAGKATSRRIARELRLGATEASKLETVFSSGMATTAAILAFVELACALVIFAISSRRLSAKEVRHAQREEQPTWAPPLTRDADGNWKFAHGYGPDGHGHREENAGNFPDSVEVPVTGRLEEPGKVHRR